MSPRCFSRYRLSRYCSLPNAGYVLCATLGLGVMQPAQSDVVNLSWDNDLLTGSDRGYTNGLRLSYLTARAEAPEGQRSTLARSLRDRLQWLPGIGAAGTQHALATSLRQMMLTPENIATSEPQYDDLPYAGFLGLETTLWSWNRERITGYGIGAGVVGPGSGAEQAQKWVHKITGSTQPRGWDNQLGSNLLVGVHAYHGRTLFRSGGQVENEMAWVVGTELSGFRTNGTAALIWRMGRHLPVNFIPDYSGASPSIGLPGALDMAGSGWSAFIGIGVEYVPYSYLDHEDGPYDLEQAPWVGQAGVGVDWHSPGFQISLIVRANTGEEDTHKEAFSYGSVAVTWRL
ncbi:MAG: lipid A deacylase LpxR family protein [Pseudomonadales bacterium]|nr:lipid A deacylase LpxR family protein [Pseudomonadales bacterium]